MEGATPQCSLIIWGFPFHTVGQIIPHRTSEIRSYLHFLFLFKHFLPVRKKVLFWNLSSKLRVSCRHFKDVSWLDNDSCTHTHTHTPVANNKCLCQILYPYFIKGAESSNKYSLDTASVANSWALSRWKRASCRESMYLMASSITCTCLFSSMKCGTQLNHNIQGKQQSQYM